MEIVVLKRAGIPAHAEVAEEFAEHCRVRARVVSFDERPSRLTLPLGSNDIVLAVGQANVEAILGTPARVISALAPLPPPGVYSADTLAPPELVLKALRAAHPGIRRIGVVHGPRTDWLLAAAVRTAGPLGIALVSARAGEAPRALRELHRLGPTVDAVWILPDPDVVRPQLFQYAIQRQLQDGIPVIAASRQQVRSGALLAVDGWPRGAGRRAAAIANRLLGGGERDPGAWEQPMRLDVTVNRQIAERLGADVAALTRLGARFE